MAYVRWSDNSDVYVYETDVFERYNCGRTHVEYVIMTSKNEIVKEYSYRKKEDAVLKLKELKAIGFKVPDTVFEKLGA